MTNPSQTRIDAALRLADALDKAEEHNHADTKTMNLGPNVKAKLASYRATLPKLRTRAEVDAEIAQKVRNCWNPSSGVHTYGEALANLSRLCAEPTATELAQEGEPRMRAPYNDGMNGSRF